MSRSHESSISRGKIRVLVVDDHAAIRRSMLMLLSMQPGLEIVGSSSNGREAVAMAAELRPDVILMDVTMPLMNGIEATRAIHDMMEEIRIIGCSMCDDQCTEERMLEAGAADYVVKTCPPGQLLNAIHGSSHVTGLLNQQPIASPPVNLEHSYQKEVHW